MAAMLRCPFLEERSKNNTKTDRQQGKSRQRRHNDKRRDMERWANTKKNWKCKLKQEQSQNTTTMIRRGLFCFCLLLHLRTLPGPYFFPLSVLVLFSFLFTSSLLPFRLSLLVASVLYLFLFIFLCDPSDHLLESPGSPGPKSQKKSQKESF